MDGSRKHDWKQSVGFPINYNSDQSLSDDRDGSDDVVMRHPRRLKSSDYLLADDGDGAPADVLGTTPPRTRIRKNEQRRSLMDGDVYIKRLVKSRRSSADISAQKTLPPTPDSPERFKCRTWQKIKRCRERDHKMDVTKKMHDERSDSFPPINPEPVLPTLVESCSRFMSLTSKLKCKSNSENITEGKLEQKAEEDDLLHNRIKFHDLFSMLIKMGNVDKNCRRTISLEEQVWQNELKDLIWLELQAKIAGNTLAQQDKLLCEQRNIVPTIVQNIIDYRFVSSYTCEGRSNSLICYDEEPAEDGKVPDDSSDKNDQDPKNDENCKTFGCLSFNCVPCTSAIGQGLKEVGTLLDSFYNAAALYSSSKAMSTHHPLIATQLFKNRLKAMCLWYNVSLHMRMRILAVRRLILTIQHKQCQRQTSRLLPTLERGASRSPERHRPCTVRFKEDKDQGGCNKEASNQEDNQKHIDDKKNSNEVDNEKVGDDCDSSPSKEVDEVAEVDETDSQAKYQSNVVSEPTTPEIVLVESQDNLCGTEDTTASFESGYLSDKQPNATDCHDLIGEYSVYNIGPLHEVIMLRLLKKCEVSPYRNYHYEVLKTQGVRRSMMFINKMRNKILQKVYLTFERADHLPEQYPETESTGDLKDEEDVSRYETAKEAYELQRYGCWSEESLKMRLPSYRSHFLLLNTICMETVHDYLSLRLDTQPANPSCLTVKQLIDEIKEGIDIATEMRNAFVRNIDAALGGYAAQCGVRRDLQRVINTFDATLDTVFKQYLSYLSTMSAVEHMPRSFLEMEWCFSARLAQRMRCAAVAGPLSFTDIVCNQLVRLLNQFKDHFTPLMAQGEKYPADSDDIDTKRHFLYAMCREAQNIYACERETTIQSVQFARLLATRLRKNPEFLHCRERIFNSLMLLRECIALHMSCIAEKTRIISSEEDLAESLHARLRELLLQLYKLGFELHKELHKMVHTPRTQPPGRRRPASLQPQPRAAQYKPSPRRPETIYYNHTDNTDKEVNLFHKELHRFVNECKTERPKAHQSIARRGTYSSVSPPKSSRPRLMRSESIGGEYYDTGVFEDVYIHSTASGEFVPEMKFEEEPKTSIAHSPQPQFVRHPRRETKPQEEAAWAVQVSRAIIEFAKCWMKFVMDRCDRGRGLRPRWANQGLEFLMLACDPYHTEHLSDEEFEELKNLMDACISHVIGSRAATAGRVSECATPPPRWRHSPSPALPGCSSRLVPAPPTPPIGPDPLLNFNLQPDSQHKSRVMEAIENLDAGRDLKLRKLRAVGNVCEAAVSTYEPRLRQVTFKWQRGLKIGAGTFGKVYTVVNTESGQLLAMKELSICAGDRRAMQRAANELQVLEGVVHPHLVRYYGCELHREEMLIFMELCVEGALEGVLAASGALPEPQVRRYTRQLVGAVLELHNRKIVHRDIKTGNIFLTNEGNCLKLGDFGCAVKIRGNTTAAGELQGYVGTQAYMAPEVFMKSSGHGRAADIWSLGCVVTEMASGKRPFSEYDSNYQIMFVVGMGGRPALPTSLSEEGQQFCLACLTHDVEERPRAEALNMHHFLMVKSDGDCLCEPGYLITKK